METIKNFISKNKQLVINYIFGCCILSGLNCLERADFNFLIFFFMYYTMFMEHKTQMSDKEMKKERLPLIIVIVLSFLIDCLWISFYSGIGYGLSVFLSYIELAAKIPITLIAVSKYLEVSKNSLGQDFQEFKDDL